MLVTLAFGKGPEDTFLMTDASTPLPISLAASPTIDAYKRDVDRTLLRENLKLTPDERLKKMISVLRFTEELRRSGKQAAAK